MCIRDSLMPGNIELSGLEVSLVNVMSRELVLRTYIEQQKERYDYILIDCMPSQMCIRDRHDAFLHPHQYN